MSERPVPLCTVMLMDVAVAPGTPQPRPAVLKKRVHGLLGRALRGMPEEGRLTVESDSAAVVCFVGDPEDGLQAALLLRDEVMQHHEGELSVRVALNIGTVEVAIGPQNRLHVMGEGLHHALQIRERAQPNEVVASHHYHQLLSQLNPDRADGFVDTVPGEPEPVKVYAAPARAGAQSDLWPLPQEGCAVDVDVVREIEQELAGQIGPVASVLVRKLSHRAATAQQLRDTLAAAILDPAARQSFQHAATTQQPQPQQEDLGTDSTRQLDVAPEELELIEYTLARFIGPMAQPLIRSEIEWCTQLRELVDALAGGIGHPQQREVFLQALRRALPDRRI